MCDVFYFKAENTLFCSKCSFTQSDLVLYYSSAPPPSLSEFLSSVPFVIFTPGAFCSALIFAQLFTSLGSALSPQVELHFLQNTKFFASIFNERNCCEQLYSGLIAFQASGRMPISTGRLKNAEVLVKNPTASLSCAACVPNKRPK